MQWLRAKVANGPAVWRFSATLTTTRAAPPTPTPPTPPLLLPMTTFVPWRAEREKSKPQTVIEGAEPVMVTPPGGETQVAPFQYCIVVPETTEEAVIQILAVAPEGTVPTTNAS